ncbi:MAG TPA: phenylalanine--tRNA ligase subunit alpha [Thermofilum sp.]|nr:phenylalanine--tRNA ligase subunit alpha [Thermofilum sp.]
MPKEYEQATVVLPPKQKKIVDLIVKGYTDIDKIAEQFKTSRESLMRDLEELREKELLTITREIVEIFELTSEAERYLELGLPEQRVLKVLEKSGEIVVKDLAKAALKYSIPLTDKEAKIGLSVLAKAKAVKIEKGKISLVQENLSKLIDELSKMQEALKQIKEGKAPEQVLSTLIRRKLVKKKSRRKIYAYPTPNLKKLYKAGKIREAPVITTLTPEILASGAWRTAYFKPFDLSVEPPTIYPGKKHPYLEFLDYIRELLVSMGFEEMKGPHVEMELWNFDALFQAQDHPAREIHDTYFLKYPNEGRVEDESLMNRIARVHEDGWETGSKGWGYKWDPRRALRLILRTQTTAVSARTLYARGDGEYMCFSLGRVFRPETLDPKHSMEFYQLEGIIVGEKVTFRHLLGFFEEIAKRLGLGKIMLKPGYFPFTEPSVEGFIKHPKLGWIEVFPGGMFRPEMLAGLGIKKSNVAAWGIGIDRIAMTVLGIDDIRLLFTRDLDFLRKWRKPIVKTWR